MLNLNLYSFAKKENSTKQPTVETAKLVQGILKEPCSIMTPVVRIERLPNDAMPFQYTYAKWVEAQRYYFIEDWTWVDGLWEVRMKEDVLATFKTEIGSQSEYILRHNSTTDFNEYISDITYPGTNEYSLRTRSISSPFVSAINDGCYIVGIISGDSTHAVGAITYYAMTPSEFGALKSKLFSNDNLDIMGIIDTSTTPPTPLVTDISQEVLKTMYNPYQYIASCMWFPVTKQSIPSYDSVTTIPIGWWDYNNLSAYRINTQTQTYTEINITLDAHPQSASRGKYLNFAPYTKRTVFGRFGTVALDTANFNIGDTLNIEYNIDFISGHCITHFGRRYTSGGTAHVEEFAIREFLIGVPIQIAQVGVDYLGTTISALNGASGAVSGAVSGFVSGGLVGGAVGAIAGVASGIYNTLQSAMPQVETSGSNGTFSIISNETRLHEVFTTIVDEDIDHRGRPLCAIRTINTLSGFILCAEGDFDISCYDNERKEIVRYLTEGFFWE